MNIDAQERTIMHLEVTCIYLHLSKNQLDDCSIVSLGYRMAEMKRLLDKNEVSQIIRVTPRSLDKYRAAGEGPLATRIGGRILFRSEDVDDWIQRRAEMCRAA